MLAIQAPRFASPASYIIMCTLLCHITADNGVGRRHVEDRRTLNVTLANVDQVDDLTVHRDLISVQHLGHHGRLGELAWEARRPILGRLVELRLPSSASCNLRSRVPT